MYQRTNYLRCVTVIARLPANQKDVEVDLCGLNLCVETLRFFYKDSVEQPLLLLGPFRRRYER